MKKCVFAPEEGCVISSGYSLLLRNSLIRNQHSSTSFFFLPTRRDALDIFGFIVYFRFQHRHYYKSADPCRGIAMETVSPVCAFLSLCIEMNSFLLERRARHSFPALVMNIETGTRSWRCLNLVMLQTHLSLETPQKLCLLFLPG